MNTAAHRDVCFSIVGFLRTNLWPHRVCWERNPSATPMQNNSKFDSTLQIKSEVCVQCLRATEHSLHGLQAYHMLVHAQVPFLQSRCWLYKNKALALSCGCSWTSEQFFQGPDCFQLNMPSVSVWPCLHIFHLFHNMSWYQFRFMLPLYTWCAVNADLQLLFCAFIFWTVWETGRRVKNQNYKWLCPCLPPLFSLLLWYCISVHLPHTSCRVGLL